MATVLGNCVKVYDECKKSNPDVRLICRQIQEMFQLWARTPTSAPDAADMTDIRDRLDKNRRYVKNVSGATKTIVINGAKYPIPNNQIWALDSGEFALMIAQFGASVWSSDTRANFEGANGAVQVCYSG